MQFQQIIFKAKPRRPFTVKLVAQDEGNSFDMQMGMSLVGNK